MRLAALVSLVLLVAACDSADDGPPRVDLQPGAELRYTTRFTTDGLFSGEAPLEETGRIVQRVVSVGQPLGRLRGLTVVESEQVEDDRPETTFRTRTWYRATDERLEEVAYEFYGDGPGGTGGLRPAGRVDLTLPRLVRRALDRAGRRLTGRDSSWTFTGVRVRETPRVVLEYPAEAGRRWTHIVLDGGAPSAGVSREVVGTETITTAAGTFRCIVVRSEGLFVAPGGSFEWLDWIADVGLVRRTIVSRDPVVNGDGSAGASVSTERVELVAVD